MTLKEIADALVDPDAGPARRLENLDKLYFAP
jgi:hypothetical protein